ncbi:DNA polymerase, putative [Entamoeba histolytica HM-1:IMSS]|uniref:DNA-directed DNA polymerase n=2 Tax=Entamoeba histolytica TaxID=5759 RepID=C4MAU5_ENTH1|nr:DNA polymerase, putative [Entamoeba histolytica HM-1:IMSS]EAL44459.2 DNA polymerase, putative [Entamoeba histolytica HM-1:IMSS]|eukprot:XP_649845.2 DNA polymerase, putative [Entamoeba histolytica HM-1:IMSS]
MKEERNTKRRIYNETVKETARRIEEPTRREEVEEREEAVVQQRGEERVSDSSNDEVLEEFLNNIQNEQIDELINNNPYDDIILYNERLADNDGRLIPHRSFTEAEWNEIAGNVEDLVGVIERNGHGARVTMIFGNGFTISNRPFQININNNNINEFLEHLVNFDIGIEEFWRNYDDEEWNLNVPPGALVREVIVESLGLPRRRRIEGGFFGYYLKEEWEDIAPLLEKYQVYIRNTIRMNENCFIQCLITSKAFKEEEIESMKSMIHTENISKKNIIKICNKYKFRVELKYYKDEENIKKEVLGNEGIIIPIFLIRWNKSPHYIFNEKVPLTSFFIKNHNEIKEYCNINNQDINKYYLAYEKHNGQYKTKKDRALNVYRALTMLKEQGAFEEITKEDIISFRLYDAEKLKVKLKQIDSNEYKVCESKEHEERKNEEVFYADFECITRGDHHIPFCMVVMDNEGVWNTFYGLDCGKNFIEYLSNFKNPICYFHNLGYDGRFLAQYGIIGIVKKGHNIYSMVIKTFKGKKIRFKDSLGLIPTSIANFKSFFNLEGEYEKEIFPYNFYDFDNLEVGTIEGCWLRENPEWDKEKIKEFKMNLIKTDCLLPNGKFNTKKYCEYYCKRDVEVLRQGFIKFKEMTKKNLDLDCDTFSTISALSYYYFKSKCFNDGRIFEYNGVLRDFIRQAIIGGRNMTNRNIKWKVKEEIVDFDACSLYPSAMKRLLIPTGYPKMIDKPIEFMFEHLMDEQQMIPTNDKFISYFVVRIKINKVGKPRNMPIILKRTKGINEYVNECVEMVVDSIYLQDLIRYQEIEFEAKEGIYWEGEKSDLLSKEIEKVYNIRADMKKNKDPNEIIYKLVMNSSYGKTIQKPILSETKFFRCKKKCDQFWRRNYVDIIYGEPLFGSDIWIVEVKKQLDDFYVPDIIGSLILSMSKRIMNELIYLCEDNNILVYYQDTDSIHIKRNELVGLQELYFNRYNRVLVGSEMGQFHSDFPKVKGKDSWAKESIFLGKKAYLDILTNEDGVEEYLIRMKGIPASVIRGEAKEKFEGDVKALYEYLYEGGALSCDLSKYGPHFIIERDFKVSTNENFKRTIKF